jgi:hypothetical protein
MEYFFPIGKMKIHIQGRQLSSLAIKVTSCGRQMSSDVAIKFSRLVTSSSKGLSQGSH